MIKNRRRTVWVLGSVTAVFSGFAYLLLLNAAFVNRQQEFGAYGQYNRTLRVVRTTGDYHLVSHGVRRELELAHLFHVEEFYLKLRDHGGRVAEFRFKKGAAEMQQTDDAALRAIVRAKFDQAVAAR